MSEEKVHKDWLPIVLMILLASVWGSSFILIKKSLLAFDPYQVASLRLSIAALAMAPFFLRHIKRVRRVDWPWLAVVGIAGTAIPAFCYPIAETQISSISTGILNSLTPVFTLLLGLLIFRIKTGVLQIMGIILGLSGAVLIITQSGSASDKNLWYGLFVVAGAMMYALSGNAISARLQHLGSITIGVVAFTLLGIPSLTYLFATDFVHICRTDPLVRISLPAVFFLALFGTAAASVLYFRLVHLTSAVSASLVAYLIPVVAIVFGLLDGEAFTIIQTLGLVLIAAGIYFSRGKKLP